ncbi:hypothetical protein SCHPADRAFT_1001320 [Schizopora paradoxa]|uniref:Uncharacterized protein n=1 Tax=Schizopora paradoxa TaxID=27342 RepID=A0A0H2R7Z5_9AGAM|nr:hypothetical protein SCHPADRAFT_1001320 [Schizopora paradoxa]
MVQHEFGRVDRGAIQALKRILLVVEKLDGHLVDSECWNISPEGIFAPRIFGECDVGAGYRALQHSLLGVEKLTAFIKRGVEICGRHRKEGRRCCIVQLPDEILVTIFHFASQVDAPPSEPRYTSDTLATATAASLSLSATCRRFRNLLLANPSEWGTWQNIDARTLKLFQKRSQDRPLLVYVDTDYHARKFREESRSMDPEEFASRYAKFFTRDRVVESMFQYRDRIRTLAIRRSGREEGVLGVAIPELAQTSSWQGVTLPLLEDLSVTYTGSDYSDKPHFFETWVMPRLRSFSIANAIPKGASCTSLGTSLVTLQLTFNVQSSLLTELSMLNLVDFLTSQPSLVDLTLRFESRMSPVPVASLSKLLQSLETLHLHIQVNFDHSIFIWSLLNCLNMPILRSFKLSIDSDVNYVQKIIEDTVRSNDRFREIQSFDLQIFAKQVLGTIDVGPSFHHLLSLRTLSIAIPKVDVTVCSVNMWNDAVLAGYPTFDFDNHHVGRLAPLERLRLCGNAFNPGLLRQLHAKYEQQEVLLKLNNLVLKNCRCFDNDLDALYKLVPANEVVWLDALTDVEDEGSDDEM